MRAHAHVYFYDKKGTHGTSSLFLYLSPSKSSNQAACGVYSRVPAMTTRLSDRRYGLTPCRAHP